MRVWIDSDGGVDDALALAMAAGRPDIEIAGSSAVFGNVSRAQAAANLKILTRLAGVASGVASGAAAAIDGFVTQAEAVHGADGLWGGAAPFTAEASESDAPMALGSFLAADGGVLGIGPATNIALALARDAAPTAKLVLMTGAYRQPGNITPHAEFNAYCDPEALARILASGAQPTLIGLDVCEKVWLAAADLAFFDGYPSSGLARLLRTALEGYIAVYAGRNAPGAHPHDAIALAALVAPELFTFEDVRVEVEAGADARGETRLASGSANARIAADIDADSFRAVFFEALGQCLSRAR